MDHRYTDIGAVRTWECYPAECAATWESMFEVRVDPREARHDACLGGQHVPGVGGWYCPCPCHPPCDHDPVTILTAGGVHVRTSCAICRVVLPEPEPDDAACAEADASPQAS